MTVSVKPPEDGARALATSLMTQMVEDWRGNYDMLVRGLHDALTFHARMEAEHDPMFRLRHVTDDREADAHLRAKNRVNRKRYLAHQLTMALEMLDEFDKRYPT